MLWFKNLKTDDIHAGANPAPIETKDVANANYEAIFDELMIKMAGYHPASDFEMVKTAYELAKNAHEGQLRKSGEPYIIHPISTALILAELELDRETITAGILHDIIEDTDYTYDDLKRIFGEEVANLVDGVTKLKKFKLEERKRQEVEKNRRKIRANRVHVSREEEQAENYRKLFMSMANDIRVILIKIADRVHNLRTLSAMSEEAKARIAKESLEIYAPIAGRLGISAMRREMEDLAFKYYDNKSYLEIKEKVKMKVDERQKYMDEIVLTLSMLMHSHGIPAEVKGRAKHFFSIHKKMKAQNKPIEEIMDVFAVRIIVDTVEQCWQALGLAHQTFTPIMERLKNYISAPKSNGYQSLHDALMGPDGEPFEIQIRTRDMHRAAESGIAAHWKYKEGITGTDASDEKISWLRSILDMQRENPDNDDYLAQLKGDLDIYAEWVHVYTPQGQVKALKKGSNPIDFAYAIHSAVGNRMTGATVNGRIVKIDHELQNGDRVEIITNKAAKGPTGEWLKLAKTNQARSKIRQWLKKETHEESVIKGKEILEKVAKAKGYTFKKIFTPEGEKLVLNRYAMNDFDTLAAAIGRGTISENSVFNRLYEEYQRLNPEPTDTKSIIDEINKTADMKAMKEVAQTGDVIIRGEGNLAIIYAKCCAPVPGDDIIGFVTQGRGVAIHRKDCKNVCNFTAQQAERLVEAYWNENKKADNRFTVAMNIICDNMACIQPVTDVLGKLNIEIASLYAVQAGSEANFKTSLLVHSRDDIEKVSHRLLSLKGVHQVDRIMS
ncbi:MAG: bifunctional (p)ppGpp synthetase/guanosine-3',5'-bis(diphosphate) 3'-pyrophosphohydrolase [Defluviitaleaceae bacterium]|nr:bifunctional (p)ppGpp synthetase/guanosine-3',5'-bis(diphosphate) 3'-pyrophosphohydrolase [Defluviitaleaceae bacterium]